MGPLDGERAHGGVAIIINKSLQHYNVPLTTNLQAVAVRACFDREITICSLYLPPRSEFSLNDLQTLINQLPPPFLLLGDFNSHNPFWGGNLLDTQGKIIDDLLVNNDLTLYNDGSMTYHNIFTGSSSAIDLSICSSSIFLNFNWSVNEFLHDSDHFPIHLNFVKNTPSSSHIKWKEKEADWVKYEQGIGLSREFESFKTHIDAYNYLSSEMLNSANNSIPKTKGKPHRPAVPWWDKTCSNLRKITRKCYRRYRVNRSATTKSIYQRAMAKQRKYFKKVKKESWLFYINGINSKTPSRLIWKKIRKLSGKFTPSPTPCLKINGDIITNPNEVANKLGEHFSEV